MLRLTPLCLLLGLAAAALPAHAADYGIGVTLNPNALSLPFHVQPDLRFEPALSYSLFEDDVGNKSLRWEVTAGLFRLYTLGPNWQLLGGARLGYRRESNQTANSTDVNFNAAVVEPAVAVEFLPIRQIAIGLEGGLRLVRFYGENAGDFSTLDTTARLTLKYFY